MYAWHQLNVFEENFPFKLFFVERLQFPPHWHKDIEIVYVISGVLKVGINNTIHILESKDILIIGTGDVHYFIPQEQYSRVVVIQFNMEICSSYKENERKYTRLLFNKSVLLKISNNAEGHNEMEIQILKLIEEYSNKHEAYHMALKARLYDLCVTLLRKVPIESYSRKERKKYFEKLKRIEKVFEYIEDNYEQAISLKEIAAVVNISEYHFCRIFREITKMTFKQFLNNYRISKAEWLLISSDDPITEIALKCGFNSIKTFNRVFRQFKDCAPSRYREETCR